MRLLIGPGCLPVSAASSERAWPTAKGGDGAAMEPEAESVDCGVDLWCLVSWEGLAENRTRTRGAIQRCGTDQHPLKRVGRLAYDKREQVDVEHYRMRILSNILFCGSLPSKREGRDLRLQ